MILIPLVVTSVISSISQINAKVIGSLGVRVRKSAMRIESMRFQIDNWLYDMSSKRASEPSKELGLGALEELGRASGTLGTTVFKKASERGRGQVQDGRLTAK